MFKYLHMRVRIDAMLHRHRHDCGTFALLCQADIRITFKITKTKTTLGQKEETVCVCIRN